MRNSITNESEHRRGLVLGFTIAEVLLLLLFLILLALGARLIKDERELKMATAFLTDLKKGGEFETTDARKLLAELTKVKALEKRVQELTEENARMKSELTAATNKSTTLEHIASAAHAIDPNESPAILKFSKNTLETFGVKLDSQKVDILAKLGSALDQMPKDERERFVAGTLSADNLTPGHTWPPIIRLSAADKYFFQVGSAELTPEFEKKIRGDVVSQLVDTARKFQVNVIEVVGHTDEQSISAKQSNLDTELLPVLRGDKDKDLKTLIPGDNAGLGLTRAVAIVEILKKEDRLKGLRILPLSGGQLIQTDETLSTGIQTGDVPERRRIEIRMRKSNQ